METSLVVQWLKSGLPLQGAQVGSLVRKLDPTWYNETSHLLQQRQRIPCASSKTWGSQINKYPLLSPVRHTVFFFFQRYIFFFNVGHFLSLYWICYSTTSVLCFVFFWWKGMWDLSSLTRDQIHTPCIGRWSLNHWTAREVPRYIILQKESKPILYKLNWLMFF